MSGLLTQSQLEADITLNYGRYQHESQERDEHGRLKDVLARTFESRMNASLDTYADFVKFSGSAALMLTERAETHQQAA